MPEMLSVIILTYNEELNLPKCLSSLEGLDAQVLIVDSFSTDGTLAIAAAYGATLIQNPFETHAKQWQFALSQPGIRGEWILGIDADQQLTPELVAEIRSLVATGMARHDGYYINRRNYFLGKWIRYGGYYPRYLLKLFKKDKVYLDEGELMDHHFYIRGTTGKLQYDLVENNLKEDLAFWSQKHVKYAQLQAREEFHATAALKGSLSGNADARRIWMKNAWNRIPLFVRPALYFIYRYIFQLGFMDGRTGLVFHFMQAFWYRFLVDSMIVELKRKDKDVR